MLPKEEVQLHPNLEKTLKKNSRNKNSKTRKSNRKSIVIQKCNQKKIKSDRKAPKMATRSSSRFKSVLEERKKHFTEQNEEHFSSQETNYIFNLGKIRKKIMERRVRSEHHVMGYHNVCTWHC